MEFIKSRWNKDNFWNLMFWVGISACMTISRYCKDDKYLAAGALWFAILGLPFILKRIQAVTFDKEHGFFTNEGRSLKNSMPNHLGLAIVFDVVLISIVGNCIDKSSLDKTAPLLISSLWAIFFLIPILYFILINCPISIFFNKNIIKPMSAAELARFNAMSATSSSISSSSPSPDYICDPKYSFISSNIHNYHHYRR